MEKSSQNIQFWKTLYVKKDTTISRKFFSLFWTKLIVVKQKIEDKWKKTIFFHIFFQSNLFFCVELFMKRLTSTSRKINYLAKWNQR